MNRPARGRACILLVDLQEDFLERDGLEPPRARLAAGASRLLEGARALGAAVLHVQTRVRADGGDRMPHWRQQHRWECVEGTPGARPPAALAPRVSEAVFAKTGYSAFASTELRERLEELGIQSLVIGGVYLHACIRSTALDAWAEGYEVCIVDDAVGSTEPVHAELTREYLAKRGVQFLDCEEALQRLGRKPEPPAVETAAMPVACVDGAWLAAPGPRRWLRHCDPVRPAEIVADVPVGREPEVSAAVGAAAREQRVAAGLPPGERLEWLRAWFRVLASQQSALTDLVVREVGKPRAEARAEISRALAHIDVAVRVAEEGGEASRLADGLAVRFRPRGVVGLVTPWNNPVAIPVGKLAPALAFGNGAVWKPAFQAPHTARALQESLRATPMPAGLVNLVFGDADTARCLIADPGIAAVAVTGSAATGRSASALCARYGKPLQAELGGNNAAIVLGDADLASAAPGLALAAFGFAGQRCTATRRFIVERAACDAFVAAFVPAVEALRVGDPDDAGTQVGPVISVAQRREVESVIELAVAEGARILTGGAAGDGGFLAPTVLLAPHAGLHVVREETFGPVAVVQVADGLEEAIALANAVEQGLVASIVTGDPTRRARFAEAAEAGILNLAPGALAVRADAPFGGWKASGIGPPEHGVWDREFYTRPQAVYGAEAEPC